MTPPFVTDAAMSREEGGRLLRAYVTDLVADKRSQPPDGSLLSALIAARDEDDRLSEAELVALTQQMLFTGHEPATNLIGNGMIALFANPSQLSLLVTALHARRRAGRRRGDPRGQRGDHRHRVGQPGPAPVPLA